MQNTMIDFFAGNRRIHAYTSRPVTVNVVYDIACALLANENGGTE